MEKAQLVYISGSGHSGSTLLNFLLGGHGKISALGEAHRIYLSANKSSKPHLCYCGKPVSDCLFWSSVSQELQKIIKGMPKDILKNLITTNPQNLDIRDEIFLLKEPKPVSSANYRLSNNRLTMLMGSRLLWETFSIISYEVKMNKTIINNSLTIYEAIRRAWNTPIIVDATKNPSRMKGLYLAAKEDFRILELIRDGRAVCYSRMKRENLPMKKCAKIWQAEQRKQWLAKLSIPKSLITRVRYEDLCQDPRKELTKICNSLGIDYQASMLNFRNNPQHGVGGNIMRFRGSEKGIKLDEKWRSKLSNQDLNIFDAIAGKLNRSLGYDR